MNKVSTGLPLTISPKIPAYWTPEQAFAVVELLDDLREDLGALQRATARPILRAGSPPPVITPTMTPIIRRSEPTYRFR